MVKLVVSDMDGTLLGPGSFLGQEALPMVQQLKQRGIGFTIATGRSRSLSEGYEALLGLKLPYISCNGAMILRRGQVIKKHSIPLCGLRALIEEADRQEMSIVFSIDGEEFYLRETPWILEKRESEGFYQNRMELSETVWETLCLEKIMIMDGDASGRIGQIEAKCRALPAQYGFTRYNDRSVEIVHREATKANGIRFLSQYLGIPMKEILAIGDHQNDCEMLRAAGIGVAVANAIPAAQENADYVTSGDHLAGVLEAVHTFCLKE